MKHLFVPYWLAVLLKARGFRETCLGIYDEKWELHTSKVYEFVEGEVNVLAPLYQQVVDWLRENEIKIIEAKNGGWNVYIKSKDYGYFVDREFYTIDEAIKHAITLLP